MKVILIDNIAYNCPTNWNEITLGDFIYCTELTESGYKKRAKILSRLTGIPEEIIYNSDPSFFNRIENIIAFFYTDTITPLSTSEFWFEGIKYCYDNNVNKTNFAQYVDILTRLEEFKDNKYKAFPYIMAILFLPEGEKYDSDKATERMKFFLSVPFPKADAALNFFLHKIKTYKKAQEYFNKAKELSNKLKSNLVKRGDGSGQSVNWLSLMAILLNRWRK